MTVVRIYHLVIGLSVALTGASLAFAQSIEHVLHISVDGLHAGQLYSLMESDPDRFTNFQRFVSEGATTFNARSDYFSPFTLPNHTSMLTGRPVLQPGDDPAIHHGYTSNSQPPRNATLHERNPAVDYIASVFDVAHDHGLSTALYTTKSKFVIYEQSYNVTAETSGGRDDTFLGDGDHGVNKIDKYEFEIVNRSSSGIVETLRQDYTNDPFDYAFVHFYEPDSVGHSYGWRSEAWNESIAEVDHHLGQIFDLIDNSSLLSNRTAIVLTADHGGSLFSHSDTSDPNVYTIPFFVWGPGVSAGRDLYEMNPLTRKNPGAELVDYLAADQPIRNGDSANLALALLGLPAVDGSSINARQDLRFESPMDVIWQGADATLGRAGDGSSWSDEANWQRGDLLDRGPVAGDIVELSALDGEQQIDLQGTRRLHALKSMGDYQLTGGDLHLLDGDIYVAEDRTLRIEGDLRTPRSIVKSGGGTLELGGGVAGSAVAASEMLISSGRVVGTDLVVDGNVANLGTLAIGSDPDVGVMTITSGYTQSSRGILEVGVASGGRSDRFAIDGTAIFRGQLSLQPMDAAAVPSEMGAVHRWQIATTGSRIGRFRNLEFAGQLHPWLDEGLSFQLAHFGDGLFGRLDYTSSDVTATLFQTVSGDANGDGAFTTEDLVTVFIAGRYESDVEDDADWLSGDWNGDADFTSEDLVEVFLNGVVNQPSILEPSQLVPEPSSGCIMVTAFVCLAIARSRRGGPRPLEPEA